MAQVILVVEDDESIREMLRYCFTSVGYAVRAYADAEHMLISEAKLPCPTLCVLDIMLPGMDGLELLRRLRGDRDRRNVPILMLTARTSEIDRVMGLETGADDYVVKPFGILELQARVKALLRRTRGEGERRIQYGALEMDSAARTVKKAGERMELTFKEFELLHLLMTHQGEVLTRDEMLQVIWGYDYSGETRTVDMHIKALRQKLGEEYITTVRGVGYKME